MIKKFYREFTYLNANHGFSANNNPPIIIDSFDCNEVRVINTSIAGAFTVVPGLRLTEGKQVVYRGNENENNLTKIIIKMDSSFFANIDYGYAVIKKKYVNAKL